MAEITVQDIRDRYPIGSSAVPDTAVTFALDSAIVDTKLRIGEATYADLSGATPSSELQASAVGMAVCYFTLARLVRSHNLTFRRGGRVVQEQDAGSPAMGSSSQVINEYLSPKEAKEEADAWEAEAVEVLAEAGVTTESGLYEFTNCNDDRDATDYVQTIPELTSSRATY